jgi:hypothetical protein
MPKKSATRKMIRKSAADVPRASVADLARLRNAMSGPIDTSEIPERRGSFTRVRRDADGMLPRRSMIRDMVVRELKRRGMTPYRLWKEARLHCPTLSQSAVHEFLKGQRQIELPYAEALLAALHLIVVRRKSPLVKKTASVGRR